MKVSSLYDYSESSHLVNGEKIPIKDESVIWKKFLHGDEESLIYIYHHYANHLYNYGCQLVRQKELVTDTIQELFFDLIDRRDRLSEVKSIKGYLFVSLRRRLLRQAKREERMWLQGEHEEMFEISLAGLAMASTSEDRSEDYALLEKHLNELPVQQKEALLLYFYEGLSYAEIAEIMDIKVKSARALTYRALESLQKRLAPFKDTLVLLLLLRSASL
ncbi:RNA polymerase sigma factor [Marinoscillum furvescens]|uniref:RNA polymerase sigma-70 factor (ECF subfamily) n=1 Tax=Marinoscillum furvescens DSM 4134 TaxID=1122208 RepID=A0A3D9L863_MARFU|nr:RNA polymerase sigma factor [Marinoscillum furvescens]REE02030.1 RNA polymerase sigma-70 factor (ECF subfamily) [Marinoscillum furvescens DSM 4134]